MRRHRHTQLREATADLHAMLDQSVAQAGFFDRRESYGEYLQRLHLFHRDFAALSSGCDADLLTRFRVHDRLGWLQSDLNDLDLMPFAPQVSEGWRAPSLPDRAGLLGSLYVILGASQGAKYLLRQTGPLDLPEGRGSAYLSRLARSDDWHGFLDHLEFDGAAAERGLLAGAIATFESFMDYMAKAVRA